MTQADLLQASVADSTLSNLTDLWQAVLQRLPFVAVGLVVIFAFWILGWSLRIAIGLIGERTQLDAVLLHVLGSIASVVTLLLGVLVAAVIVFPTFRPGDLVAGLGLTTVAVGFAFKDMLQNTFAGLFILWRKPFRIGDQIRSNQYEGTVEEINVRSTFIKTYDGERVVIPNVDIYTAPVLVRTAFPVRRVCFTVGIGYGDSIDQARAVITDALSGIPGVVTDPGPWIYTTELAPSFVKLVIYFWTGSEQSNVLHVSHQVATGIRQALGKAGIEIPYPYQVTLLHNVTGTRQGDRPFSGVENMQQ